jgi:guanine nucleotide-binding protein subunit alpha
MRLIHRVPFSPQEKESFRQLTFDNITRGLKYLLEAMDDMGLKVTEENMQYLEMVENAQDLRDGEPFPKEYYVPLKSLWTDPNVQKAWSRGNEAALPEKSVFLDVVFSGPSTDYTIPQSDVFLLVVRPPI